MKQQVKLIRCQICRKEFGSRDGKFCSRICYYESKKGKVSWNKRERVEVQCLYCKKRATAMIGSNYQFCSPKCYHENSRISKLIEAECPICKEIFKSKHKTCSYDCGRKLAGIGIKKSKTGKSRPDMVGDNNPSRRPEVLMVLSEKAVERMRSGAILGRKGNSGWFKSKKNRKKIFYRCSWELFTYQIRELDPNVIKYENEPIWLIYFDKSGKQHRSVPDLLTYYKDGTKILEEVKPKWKIDTNYQNTNEKLKAYKVYCRKNKIGFKLISDKDIQQYKNILHIK